MTSLALDLLALAPQILELAPRRPSQAILRRCVSTAYYAVFHLLLDGITERMSPTIRRSIPHHALRTASEHVVALFMNPSADAMLPLKGVKITKELYGSAQAVVALYAARIDADYELQRTFTKFEVESLLEQAKDAKKDWQVAKAQPCARGYLTLVLLLASNGKLKEQ